MTKRDDTITLPTSVGPAEARPLPDGSWHISLPWGERRIQGDADTVRAIMQRDIEAAGRA